MLKYPRVCGVFCYNTPMTAGNKSYVAQVIEELKKVTWPTRAQTVRSTFVVLLISLIIGVYVGIIDFALAKLLQVVAK